MTFSELLLLLAAIGSLVRWWMDRRDARSTLAKAKEVSDTTVTTLTAALVTKNEELEDQKEETAFWRERAEHLERLVYSGGAH